MYQIFDCFGKPVGRPQGYAKHSTAEGLITRSGAIRRAIWDAYAKRDWAEHQIRFAWAIRWVEGDKNAQR